MTTWETSDLYLAAFLLANDFELASTRRTDRTFFVFEDEQDLQDTLGTWGTPRGMVIGHKFAHCIKDLKALVHR